MTLLTETPAAGGQPPAPPTPATPPSSGEVAAKPGEQQAAGKEPAAPPAPAADAAGKAKIGNGGEQPKETAGDKPNYQGAPEAYEFKPSPEGLSVGADVQGAFSEVARELNLSQVAAQMLVDKVSPALRAQASKNITSMIDGWVEEAKADPDIGGEKLEETLAYARKAIDLGPPELRSLLGHPSKGGTGLGNHKAIIKWAAAIGRKLSPDAKVVTGSTVTPPAKTAEERLADTYR